jgi:hypothetical protein
VLDAVTLSTLTDLQTAELLRRPQAGHALLVGNRTAPARVGLIERAARGARHLHQAILQQRAVRVQIVITR